MINAVLYARYSSDNQRGESITAQLRARHAYLLSGLAYCGECGAPMHGKTTTSHTPHYRENQYYLCGTQSRKGKSGCANKAVNLNELESLILNKLEAVIDSYHSAIKTKSAENIRALISNFINKVVIHKEEIVIEFKINYFDTYGAPGRNRTYAPGSGGQCSIHWATGALNSYEGYYIIIKCLLSSLIHHRKLQKPFQINFHLKRL